ncbi:hypothetical protein BU14_0357s0010 [Porphyra umbilicalis]|uniref:Hedgehog protein Hint domain-containing protein n=1 Tax=Porphyra umbilicalis TaxID=2786 RepID=A0A1X6NXL2_PORUM|nr:hypothetical protein BU14_0357s0010 [Porphyra umbilicalis]|eukprot:OSX73317.1 hypothetical protein BU14_0357s0010 [Porphyra umbilicalis]
MRREGAALFAGRRGCAARGDGVDVGVGGGTAGAARRWGGAWGIGATAPHARGAGSGRRRCSGGGANRPERSTLVPAVRLPPPRPASWLPPVLLAARAAPPPGGRPPSPSSSTPWRATPPGGGAAPPPPPPPTLARVGRDNGDAARLEPLPSQAAGGGVSAHCGGAGGAPALPELSGGRGRGGGRRGGGEGEVRVDALATGDSLAVAPRAAGGGVGSSLLLGWSHADAAAVSRCVALTYTTRGRGCAANATADGVPACPPPRTLRASPGHHLYTPAGDLVPAADVAVGDTLVAANGSPAHVTSVTTALDVGLCDPHPAAGELIVDCLRVSAYTTAVPRAVAHAALAPVRAAAGAGVADARDRLRPAGACVDGLVGGWGGGWRHGEGGTDAPATVGLRGAEL